MLLYKELHPRDTTVTIDDIQIETLKSVMINDIINDLGFTVESGTTAKFILLFEAQSKWTENLTLRMLFYLAETYHRYLIKTKQSEHAYKKINLPKPELYVVYTGSKDLPDEISFKEDYFVYKLEGNKLTISEIVGSLTQNEIANDMLIRDYTKVN